MMEGDISWAERFLGETETGDDDDSSIPGSFGLKALPDSHFDNAPSASISANVTLATDHEHSANDTTNYLIDGGGAQRGF